MKLRNLVLLCLLTLAWPSAFVSAQEVINNFVVDIYVNQDGTFLVEETIDYNFGTLFRHGIFRDLPTTHPQPATGWFRNRSVEYTDISVATASGTTPYEVIEDSDTIRIKIGDPNEEITGTQTYTISYLVRGGLSYLENDTTELFWNVSGHEWEVPIRQVVARVHDQDNVFRDSRFCYAGPPGGTDSCQSVSSGTTTTTFISPILNPGEGMTIAQELQPSVEELVVESIAWHIPALLVGLVWLLGLGGWVYRYRTEHKPAAPVISQYEPYQDFKPMFSGVLVDGHLHDRDITAGIVYLAQTGFLTIKKTERKAMLFFEVDDYEVTLKKPLDVAETTFLRSVLLLLFEADAAVETTTSLSTLKRDQSKQRANQKQLQELRAAAIADLERQGYFERILSLPAVVAIAMIAIFFAPVVFGYFSPYLGSATIPLLVVVVGTACILGFAYQRRTRKGYEALNHLKGFKDFLSVTEKDRLKFHNAPSKSPEQFMANLPYAIAFGVEKEWVAVFKDITIPTPDWYQGDASGAFVAGTFASDINAFSSSFTQSTGTSASSGGGSVGGGAGGGGGGSW